jgi:uncharacterized protein (DUF885 family)
VLAPVIDRFSTDAWALQRFYDVPTSEARDARMDRFLTGWQERLAGLDWEALDRDARIDLVLLSDHLTHARQQLELAAARVTEIREWIPFAPTLVRLEEARVAMEPLDPKVAAAELAELVKTVEATRKSLEERAKGEDPGSPVLARRAAGEIDELRETLKGWYEYYAGYDPVASFWLAKPHEKAAEDLEAYAKFLREKVAGIVEGEEEPLIGDPIGRQAILIDLRHERIPYSPEQLVAIARQELAWCLEEMKKAAAEMGHGDDWKAALEEVKNDYVPPGEQDDLVRDLARESIAFLDEHQLVTIPDLARETWRLEMISAERQKLWPFAYYGGQHMAVAYPTPEMTHERKLESMRGNNVHFTRNVTQHELIPGHHLQGFMANRHREYRQVFHTPFLGEGWALHWERLLYDLGFPQSPENRIGMLLWRMHRCARVIVSLGFHLGEMTPEEMVDFLVDDIGLERDGATGEVRRYIQGDYSPLYQCAYLIGGIQIGALRQELVGPAGLSEREFHDAVLRQGPIPVELIRAALRPDVPITRDAEPDWRFVGEVALGK